MAGPQVIISRGNVIVAAGEGQGGGVGIRAVVRKKIQAVLPDRTIDNKIVIKTDEKTVVARVANLTMTDGWIAVAIE